MKNSYLVEKDLIIFRRARLGDNMEEIAELIYETDPYIYPFWFENDKSEGVRVLSEKMLEPGFIFYYDNLYVAYDKTIGRILGVICALDKSINLNYDYTNLESVNDRYSFTIKNYIKVLINEVEDSRSDYMYISNVCVDTGYRGKHIGTKMLGYFITQMEKAGFNSFGLDCLLHNLRAKNLYHSFMFKEMKEIIGFDGTDHSKIEVVSMLRKKGAYLPEEFR